MKRYRVWGEYGVHADDYVQSNILAKNKKAAIKEFEKELFKHSFYEKIGKHNIYVEELEMIEIPTTQVDGVASSSTVWPGPDYYVDPQPTTNPHQPSISSNLLTVNHGSYRTEQEVMDEIAFLAIGKLLDRDQAWSFKQLDLEEIGEMAYALAKAAIKERRKPL